MAYQTQRMRWFGGTWLTKLYKDNGLGACGLPNVTYTMVWECMAHETLQIHKFDLPGNTKLYIYNGVGTHCSPNQTNTMV